MRILDLLSEDGTAAVSRTTFAPFVARRLQGVLCTIAVLAMLAGCGVMSKEADTSGSRASTSAKLDTFSPPKPARWTLPNGLEVMYLEDPELPLVSGSLYLRGGTWWEGADSVGSIAAMGDELRLGGTETLPPDELDLRLEKLSAAVDSNFSSEFGKVSFACLETDLSEVFGLFADVVLRPRFDRSRLELWRGHALESIRRRIDEPATVASIAFNQIIYGDSPYGRVATSKDIKRLNREMLLRQYSRFVRPKGALLTITGKVARTEIEKLIEARFGAWQGNTAQRREPPVLEYPALAQTPRPGVTFIEMPLEQSTVLMGHLGVRRLTPDQYAIEVFNSIFGKGGFGSRLMINVRTDLGLAYNVYGAIIPSAVEGRNLVFLQTKSESTVPAIEASFRTVDSLRRVPAPEEELLESKESLEHTFVFNFESAARIVARKAQLRLLGYPEDYDESYLANIGKQTSADVQSVAERLWKKNDFSIVIVGNARAYEDVVKAAGTDGSPLKGYAVLRATFDETLQSPRQ